jgi:SAM-dependent methyltransferase
MISPALPFPPKASKVVAELVLISFLGLFLELALIRWIPGCVKIIGYYTNLVLISTVLGMGLGCASAEREDGLGWYRRTLQVPVRLLVSLTVYAVVQYIGLLPLPAFWGERVWSDLGKTGIIPSLVMPEVVFILNTWTFLPLGRGLGRAVGRFPSLYGYSLNLAGGLAGITILTMMASGLGLDPPVWFGAALLVFLGWQLTLGVPFKPLAAAALVGGLCLAAVVVPSRQNLWSPYYKISISDFAAFFGRITTCDEGVIKSLGLVVLSVNDDYFQFGLDLDPVAVANAERKCPIIKDKLAGLSDYVQVPYRLHPPRRVLILGSGLGNDVAAALRNGAETIDAVEIDPLIIRLGQTLHPERPYANRKVTVHNTDARRFLKDAAGKYDLIVYAFLDSHSLLSAFSSVRLDSYVYTQESFREAARLLAPDGEVVVMFAASRDFVGKRLFGLVNEVFPGSARALEWERGSWGRDYDVIIGGPGLASNQNLTSGQFKDVTALYRDYPRSLLPSDDWPFLYLQDRAIAPAYGLTMLALLGVAVIFTWRVLPNFGRLQPNFFCWGPGSCSWKPSPLPSCRCCSDQPGWLTRRWFPSF